MQNAWGKFWRTWCTFWSTCRRKFLYLARKYLNIIVFASNQFAIIATNKLIINYCWECENLTKISTDYTFINLQMLLLTENPYLGSNTFMDDWSLSQKDLTEAILKLRSSAAGDVEQLSGVGTDAEVIDTETDVCCSNMVFSGSDFSSRSSSYIKSSLISLESST